MVELLSVEVVADFILLIRTPFIRVGLAKVSRGFIKLYEGVVVTSLSKISGAVVVTTT